MTGNTTEHDGNIAPISMTVPYITAPVAAMEGNPDSHNQFSTQRGVNNESAQSRSLPSTPYQRPQSRSGQRVTRSPDPSTKSGSPLSLPSDKSRTPPARGRPYGGCKYETGMARARRRVPYSFGPEPLQKDKSDLKTRLNHEEDEALTREMQNLYSRLLPTAESEQRRTTFIDKLDRLLRDNWPTSSFTVNVFGSTGNNLGTLDSDVDICITTDCKEMERVCSIAELLAKNGMERVVCVSSAKVPIVKVWDPELQVASDINVNNPLALENTDLVRTYVDLDSRVRPLAMIIKYWAKRRILNDAALGGTLSSYTWICLALNFLQTRDPPILPTLQQQPKLEPKILAGVNVSFDRNTESYKDFGARNKSSLGELLFHFFRYYGHELDFEQNVVSVRLGRILSKVEKQWHLLQDNRLCVEEPFNLSRNLANTADDTSMRGIHMELRRAFELIGGAKLDDCCEQFEYPKEEIKLSEHFVPPSARPVIPQPPTQSSAQPSLHLGRPGKGSNRGGRGSKGPNSNSRRSSNPTGRTSNSIRNFPFQMTPQELQLQAQHQQHLLHDQLFQQYQYLQLQEQELRMQLHQQNLRHRGLLAAGYHQPAAYGQYGSQDEGFDGTNGQINGMSRAPMSAPLYQQRFGPASPYLTAGSLSQGVSTNPPSPRVNSVIPDTRRFSRRTSLTQSSSGPSLRAQSQPARAVPVSSFGHMSARPDVSILQEAAGGRRSSVSSSSQEQFPGYLENGYNVAGSMYDSGRRPAEYLGYYVGQSPSLSAYTHSTAISPIPSHVGLAIQNGGLSPRLASASIRSNGSMHSPPLQAVPPATAETQSIAEPEAKKFPVGSIPPQPRSGPLIVDGSVNSPRRRRTTQSLNESDEPTNFSASTSEDLAFDTPSSSDENSQDALELNNHKKSPPASPSAPQRRLHQMAGSSQHMNGFLPFRTSLSAAPQDLPIQETRTEEAMAMAGLGALKKPGTAWTLDRQLSSVEEVLTPSPRVESFLPEGQPPNVAQSVDQAEPAAASEAETTTLANGNGGDEAIVKPLSPRTNGSTGENASPASAAVVGATNGWETQHRKKKRRSKKAVKSENDAQVLNTTKGEILPADESLRKGG
ncbi:poly(A) polymerase, variant [Exophiala viscosa]|uniref:polynucleotide adenylyltransferase n=1 Tax=Exophiala viscosa TaxID=2486360 RepID=A0AAN6E5P9_9EURO|nr:poly(A) polymerase, variant [Exophiala viscosa]